MCDRFCSDDAMLLMVCWDTPGTPLLLGRLPRPGRDSDGMKSEAAAAAAAAATDMDVGSNEAVVTVSVARRLWASPVRPASFSNDECRDTVDYK